MIDIIIPFHSRDQFDTREYIQNCVASIERHTPEPHKYIFVDDWSDDIGHITLKALASSFPNSLIIRTQKQRWFTRAVNLGLRMVRTPWCVSINSDCVVDNGWLDEMRAVRDEVQTQGQKVGLVGSVLSAEEPRRYQIARHPDYVTGHCFLLSMQSLYEVSCARGTPGIYLDELSVNRIHIFSDNALCEDMEKLGWAAVKSFKSAVGHVAGKSWGHNLSRVFSLSLEEVND